LNNNFDLKELIRQSTLKNLKDNFDESDRENSDQDNFDDLSHHSIHSIISLNKINIKNEQNFHEEIHKTIEKEIKKDILINDLNISLSNNANNLNGKTFSETFNKIICEDQVLISENMTNSLDTGDKKLNTPKFSQLNLSNGVLFELNQIQQLNTRKVLSLLMKSWYINLPFSNNFLSVSNYFIKNFRKKKIKNIKNCKKNLIDSVLRFL